MAGERRAASRAANGAQANRNRRRARCAIAGVGGRGEMGRRDALEGSEGRERVGERARRRRELASRREKETAEKKGAEESTHTHTHTHRKERRVGRSDKRHYAAAERYEGGVEKKSVGNLQGFFKETARQVPSSLSSLVFRLRTTSKTHRCAASHGLPGAWGWLLLQGVQRDTQDCSHWTRPSLPFHCLSPLYLCFSLSLSLSSFPLPVGYRLYNVRVSS